MSCAHVASVTITRLPVGHSKIEIRAVHAGIFHTILCVYYAPVAS